MKETEGLMNTAKTVLGARINQLQQDQKSLFREVYTRIGQGKGTGNILEDYTLIRFGMQGNQEALDTLQKIDAELRGKENSSVLVRNSYYKIQTDSDGYSKDLRVPPKLVHEYHIGKIQDDELVVSFTGDFTLFPKELLCGDEDEGKSSLEVLKQKFRRLDSMGEALLQLLVTQHWHCDTLNSNQISEGLGIMPLYFGSAIDRWGKFVRYMPPHVVVGTQEVQTYINDSKIKGEFERMWDMVL